jgi:hypothetical protein
VLQLQLERLSNEVRRYQNSRVRPECGEQWTWYALDVAVRIL